MNELCSREIANGTCAIMAIAIREENLEDAYTACESWARNTVTERITTVEINVEKEDNQGIPEENDYRMDRYHDMDPHTGLPKIGEYRAVGDAIFAKYRYEMISTGESSTDPDAQPAMQIVNKSEFVEIGKDGYVQKIKEFVLEKTRVFRITIASVRTVETGNKIATRYSQKGVLGGIIPRSLMPPIVTGKRAGLRPDLIFSPMSLTSRATPAVILELLLGNYSVATGEQVDASAFSMTPERLIEYNRRLEELGYEPWGIETYEHPVTRQRFQMMTGVAYVRILKHTAFEKQKACGFVNVSSIDKIQRQPSKGGPTAPVKGGYMDRDVLAAHSCANLITSMFRDQTDKTLVDLCSNCGHLCDRCNRDPESVVDVYAATHCTKCGEQALVTTKVPWTMVNVYFSLLSIGVKLSQWPGIE
jgi:DNA-directed RNA polymerase beta subunit